MNSGVPWNSDLPISALILDAGNTKVRITGWQGQDQDRRYVGRCQGLHLPAAAPLVELAVIPTPNGTGQEAFVAALARIGVPFGDLPVVLTSVVPEVVPLVRSLWPDVSVIDHTCDLPFEVLSPRPQNIGPDRLCNVAAATASGCQRALIVDAGTATTFDLLVDGTLLGGLIAPGMALAANCLGELAARLEPVPFAACPLEPGLDTADAMRAGAFHTGIGGVEAVINGLCQKYGPLPVVITGGLGEMLPQSGRHFDAHWTLRGAAVLSGLKLTP